MSSKKPSQTSKTRIPEQTAEETRAAKLQAAVNEQSLYDSGYTFDGEKLVKRELSPEEQQNQDFNSKIQSVMQQRMLGGPVDPQTQALVGQYYDAARQTGTSQIDAFAREQAGARGLDLTSDSPAMRESLMAKSNLETGLGGAQAGALLDQGNAQQIFAQNINQFQQQLQQQAFINRQSVAGNFGQARMQMAGIRGMEPTTKTTTSSGQSTFLRIVNGLMQGASSGGGLSGILGGALGGGLNKN